MGRTAVATTLVVGCFLTACGSTSGGGGQAGDRDGPTGAAGSPGGNPSVGAGGSSAQPSAPADAGGAGRGGAGGGAPATTPDAGPDRAGGAGGQGGQQGSATPMAVGKCDGLGAPNKWEYIWATPSRTGLQKGDATGVVVDPFEAGTVWATAYDAGMMKSTDCGSTWAHVNAGRNGAMLDHGGMISIAVDPIEKGVIYVTPIYGPGGVWKSTNGGVDWDNLIPGNGPQGKIVGANHFDSISMDPHDHRHLVAGTHANCADPYGPACEAETADGGATWTFVKLPTKGWEEGGGPWVIDATSWLYTGNSGMWLTTDHGASWKNVTPMGVSYFQCGEVENHVLPRAADGTYYLTSLSGMVKSTDAMTWTLVPSSGGRKVGFAMGSGLMFASDQWSNTYHMATEANPTAWTKLAPPANLPASQGAPHLSYDTAHHVLYSSNFAGGLWRVVITP